MHPDLALRDGPTLTFSVPHFSGAGSIVIAPLTLQELVDDQVGQDGWYEASLAALYLDGETQPVAYANVMNEWYDDALAPGLAAANDDGTLRAEMGDYVAWAGAHELIPDMLFWSDLQTQLYRASGIDDRVAAGREVARTALTDAFDRNNDTCEAQQSLAHAESAMRWHWIGRELDLWPNSDDEALQAARDQLCVEMIFTAIDYPQSPTVGQPGLLTATLGPSFDGSSIADGEDWSTLLEILDALGTEELFGASFEGTEHEIAFTPTGERELSLRGAGCLDMPEYPALGEDLCIEVAVVRGFTITPTSAEVSPGGVTEFEALLFGDPHPGVTWTATGGTIDGEGVFIASAEQGSITVTATSQTTPGLQQTAIVTVGEPCAAAPRAYFAYAEDPDGNDVEDGPNSNSAEVTEAGGEARASGNTAYATQGSASTWYEFSADISWGIALTPADPADAGAPVSITVRAALDHDVDPDEPWSSSRGGFECGGSSVDFRDVGEGFPEAGEYGLVVDTSLGESLECRVWAVGEDPDFDEVPFVEVTFLGIDVTSAAAYELCMN